MIDYTCMYIIIVYNGFHETKHAAPFQLSNTITYLHDYGHMLHRLEHYVKSTCNKHLVVIQGVRQLKLHLTHDYYHVTYCARS